MKLPSLWHHWVLLLDTDHFGSEPQFLCDGGKKQNGFSIGTEMCSFLSVDDNNLILSNRNCTSLGKNASIGLEKLSGLFKLHKLSLNVS